MEDKTPRSILVVDNDPFYLKSIVTLLQIEGYVVYSADSLPNAAAQLAERYIDLIIIDNRLDNNANPYDNSGADFVRNADPSQAIILMSMFIQDGLALERVSHNLRIFSKTRAVAELIELVGEVLHTLVPYNQDLEIVWVQGTSADVVNRLDTHKNGDLVLSQVEKELDEILRKLFWIESKIVVYAVEEGHGGSAVLKVFSTINHSVNRPPIIVKFGWRDVIDSELFNYRVHVEPYFYMRTTQIVGQPAYTHHLAGFKQMFVGYEQDWRPHINGNHSNLINFATAFDEESASTLRTVVQTLFYDTYSVWFAGKQSLSMTQDMHLTRLKSTIPTYEDQLGLQSERKRHAIRHNIGQLQEVSFANVTIHVEEMYVTFIVKGVEEKLVHPVYFWQHFAHCFPATTYVSLTHGDLNPYNIFVNPRADSWLLDFQRTGWGPLMRDAAELESAIKFSLLKIKRLTRRIEFERAILQIHNLSTPLDLAWQPTQHVEKAQVCIQTIRNEMTRVGGDPSLSEYYVALFFYALKMLSFSNANEVSQRPVNRAHMTYSAAKIAQFLMRNHV